MKKDNTIEAFFALVRGGLWEKDVRLLPFGKIDFSAIYKLAEEQSVVGLVAAGLEHVVDTKVPKEDALTFVGTALQLEQRNIAMNSFICALIERMKAAGIRALLVKGQGIAQCYNRPLWRTCGDIDFLLNNDNYEKAKQFLLPLATSVSEEDVCRLHYAMMIGQWDVELHGTLHSGLMTKLDNTIDDIQREMFTVWRVRKWANGNTPVYLPSVNDDIIFVFAHILQHFFKSGIGLRQICDLSRLLWTNNDGIDYILLERRLCEMGIMSEWKTFATMIVNTLGMPEVMVPLYTPSLKWSRKANKVLKNIIKTGNLGHNRDKSYYQKNPYLVIKAISLWHHTKTAIIHFSIFPLDSIKVLKEMIKIGIYEVAKGK